MKLTFAALGVADDLVRALADDGITEPLPIQSLTLPDSLAGRDVCGKAETGSGKTLAYGLPLVQRTERSGSGRSRSLVVVPTRELAVQVGEVLTGIASTRRLRVATLYGGVSLDRQTNTLRRGVDIIVATPGRLIDLVERRRASLADVRLVVLDEADRMADMGFLPQVEWLLGHVNPQRQTMLFSATLDGDVDGLVRRFMTTPIRHEAPSAQATVSSMSHHFFAVHQLDKVKVVASAARGAARTLVFVRTKRGADRLARQLSREGMVADAIHGDLRQSARERALRRFAAGAVSVLTATDVAARGLDISGIDLVVHYDPPEDHKAYLHRSGRTARAGGEGVVLTLVLWNQALEVERLQRRLRLREPIVEVFSNDARLPALASRTAEGLYRREAHGAKPISNRVPRLAPESRPSKTALAG